MKRIITIYANRKSRETSKIYKTSRKTYRKFQTLSNFYTLGGGLLANLSKITIGRYKGETFCLIIENVASPFCRMEQWMPDWSRGSRVARFWNIMLEESKFICNKGIPGIRARRIFSGGEARSTKGGLVRGVAAWGVPGADPAGRRRFFQKICKKSMKNYNFLKIFKKISRFFQKIFENFG